MPSISQRSLNEIIKLKNNKKLELENLCVDLGEDLIGGAALEALIRRYQNDNFDTSLISAENFLKEVYLICEEDFELKEVSALYINGENKINTKWQIKRIFARNYRGLTDWNDEFLFDLDAKPFFFYGLNGSGKTCILSAIVWCLTANFIQDRVSL